MTGSSPRRTRAEQARDRAAAIIEAAAAEFVANGYAGARVEDVAARAGVAKGTVYLNFADKQALFEAVVKARMTPVAAELAASLDRPGPSRAIVAGLLRTAMARLAQPQVGDMVRLVLAESIRFPELTAFYRREVVGPVVIRLRQVLHAAAEAGELTSAATADYAPLVVAPMLLAAVAGGSLADVGVDDVGRMLEVHLDNLFGGAGRPGINPSPVHPLRLGDPGNR